jgi:hypothetical protein
MNYFVNFGHRQAANQDWNPFNNDSLDRSSNKNLNYTQNPFQRNSTDLDSWKFEVVGRVECLTKAAFIRPIEFVARMVTNLFNVVKSLIEALVNTALFIAGGFLSPGNREATRKSWIGLAKNTINLVAEPVRFVILEARAIAGIIAPRVELWIPSQL